MLSHIVGPYESVSVTEIVPDPVRFGRKNLAKFDLPRGQINPAGKPARCPGQTFDCILVSAAARTIPPSLVDQLGRDGRLVIPAQSSIYLVVRDDQGRVAGEEFLGFSFVPLIT